MAKLPSHRVSCLGHDVEIEIHVHPSTAQFYAKIPGVIREALPISHRFESPTHQELIDTINAEVKATNEANKQEAYFIYYAVRSAGVPHRSDGAEKGHGFTMQYCLVRETAYGHAGSQKRYESAIIEPGQPKTVWANKRPTVFGETIYTDNMELQKMSRVPYTEEAHAFFEKIIVAMRELEGQLRRFSNPEALLLAAQSGNMLLLQGDSKP